MHWNYSSTYVSFSEKTRYFHFLVEIEWDGELCNNPGTPVIQINLKGTSLPWIEKKKKKQRGCWDIILSFSILISFCSLFLCLTLFFCCYSSYLFLFFSSWFCLVLLILLSRRIYMNVSLFLWSHTVGARLTPEGR